MTTFISRRDILKRAGVAGAVALVPASLPGSVEALVGAPQRPERPRQALQHLTQSEAETLDAVVARLIPTDETGPGAIEAGAPDDIDRALGGALASSREAYKASRGSRFVHSNIARQAVSGAFRARAG